MIILTQTPPRVSQATSAPHRFPVFGLPVPRATSAVWAGAMLVVLLVAASLAMLRSDRHLEQIVAPMILPALSGTPENAEATPAVPTTSVSLLHLDLPESRTDRAFVSLERYTLPPAASMAMDMRAGNTPLVSYIAAGAVQVQLDETSPSAQVVRVGGTAPEEELAKAASATLATGDALVLPEQGRATVTNDTAQPAEVVLLFQPTGVPAVLATAGDFYTMGTQVHTISGPLTLDLRQETLAPGSAVARSDDPQVVQITGALDASRVMDVRTTSGGALRNAGAEPLAVYVLTVTSAGPQP